MFKIVKPILFPHFSELTKQEVRTLEGKLIKHFSKQLATRATLTQSQVATVPEISRFPSLPQWLAVVGITKDSSDVIQVLTWICSKVLNSRHPKSRIFGKPDFGTYLVFIFHPKWFSNPDILGFWTTFLVKWPKLVSQIKPGILGPFEILTLEVQIIWQLDTFIIWIPDYFGFQIHTVVTSL